MLLPRAAGVLLGSWCGELELGIEPWHSSVGTKCFHHQTNCLLLPFLLFLMTYFKCIDLGMHCAKILTKNEFSIFKVKENIVGSKMGRWDEIIKITAKFNEMKYKNH